FGIVFKKEANPFSSFLNCWWPLPLPCTSKTSLLMSTPKVSLYLFIGTEFMKEPATWATTTWKRGPGLTDLNEIKVEKSGDYQCCRSLKASPYNITLLRSFVLSD